MSKSTLRVVDNEIEHPLDYARRKVREWRSDAEAERLPTTNIHDDKGAPLLDRDAVLRKSYPNHAGKKA